MNKTHSVVLFLGVVATTSTGLFAGELPMDHDLSMRGVVDPYETMIQRAMTPREIGELEEQFGHEAVSRHLNPAMLDQAEWLEAMQETHAPHEFLEAYEMAGELREQGETSLGSGETGEEITDSDSRYALPLWPDFQVNENVGRCDHYNPAVGVGPNGHSVVVWEDGRDGYTRTFLQRYDAAGNLQGTNSWGWGGYYPAVAVDASGGFVIVWASYLIYGQRFDSDGNPIGYTFQVTDVSVPCYDPSISMDASGNFVVTWVDDRNGNYDIYAQRYDSSGNPVDDNFLVNDDIWSADQYDPSMAMDASGNFVVTWVDYRNVNYDIYAQRYDSSGNPVGGNFLVNDDGVGTSQYHPSVAMDASGDFAVTWADYRNVNCDIYAQRYDSSGNPLDDNFLVNDDIWSADQYDPSMAMDASGNFVVTWVDYRNVNYDIYAQRYDSSGNPLDDNFLVNDDGVGSYQSQPSMAIDTFGNFVVTWEDDRNGNPDIYAQRYDSTGNPVGGNFLVNDDTGSTYQYDPSVSVDASGNFVVAWEDDRNGPWDIYAQRYDSSGNPVDDNFLVNDDIGSAYQYDPSVAMDAPGNFVVAWRDRRNVNYDIYAQRYDSSGNPVHDNFLVNDDIGSAYQYDPSVALDASGNFVVAWEDYRNGNRDIYAQRYDSSGNPLGGNFLVNDDIGYAYQYDPSVAMDASDNFAVAWGDKRNGHSDIYAQRYDSAGNPVGGNFLVNDDIGSTYQYDASVAMDASGNFVVTWEDRRKGHYDIYAQQYDPSGHPVGDNFLVNDDIGSDSQYEPSVGMDASGNFVVAWQDYRNSYSDIYAQRYDSAGNPVGNNFLVNDDGVGSYQNDPSVCMDSPGNFLVAWMDYRSGSNIYAQHYLSDGSPDGANWQVNTESDGSKNRPSIGYNGERAVVAWYDNRVPGQGWDIWASGWEFFDWNLSAEVQGSDLVLTWSEAPGADLILVFREIYPYFEPDVDGGSNLVATLSGNTTMYADPYGVGDSSTNAYYILISWDLAEEELGRSRVVGEFDYDTTIPTR